MKIRQIFKKIFWPVFIIIFLIVAVFVGKIIYDKIYQGQMEKILNNMDPYAEEADTNLGTDVFSCENDNSVKSRGYVYLHGLGDHNPAAVNFLENLTQDDSKTKGILDFDYSEQLTLDEISNDFVSEFNTFKSQYDLEEIVIIGQSAGGVVAAYSAHKLNFDGDLELHTIASPLNGYGDFGTSSKQMAEGMTGFAKEIGLGFAPFIAPQSQNIKVYHHKTLEDEDLRSWCGSYAAFCSPKIIQNNNIEDSKEFYYPDYNHTSIVSVVSGMIVDCHI